MENQNETKCRPFQSQSVIFGLLVLLAGLLLMLKNFGALSHETSRIIFSWPMLLVAIGVLNLSGKSKIWGIILVAVGGFFLGTRFLGLSHTFGDVFWPALIIVVGLALVFSASGFWKSRQAINKVTREDDVVDDVAIFGGVEKTIYSNSFKGGEIVAIFGGSKLNLTKATLAPGYNQLEIVTIFGGATIIVPSDWNVKIDVINILGGFSDKRELGQIDVSKTLIIKGVAIFGGGEVKSY
ncbi:MAG: DUF5668 domain-containing protein [Bacteroidales bacterium]|nr:DUF5668 domain-containing protein [Bacteroidales bacterium]MDZ4203255.1 DUF5668 domain-containing protein [Bacteroidales bacterium]